MARAQDCVDNTDQQATQTDQWGTWQGPAHTETCSGTGFQLSEADDFQSLVDPDLSYQVDALPSVSRSGVRGDNTFSVTSTWTQDDSSGSATSDQSSSDLNVVDILSDGAEANTHANAYASSGSQSVIGGSYPGDADNAYDQATKAKSVFRDGDVDFSQTLDALSTNHQEQPGGFVHDYHQKLSQGRVGTGEGTETGSKVSAEVHYENDISDGASDDDGLIYQQDDTYTLSAEIDQDCDTPVPHYSGYGAAEQYVAWGTNPYSPCDVQVSSNTQEDETYSIGSGDDQTLRSVADETETGHDGAFTRTRGKATETRTENLVLGSEQKEDESSVERSLSRLDYDPASNPYSDVDVLADWTQSHSTDDGGDESEQIDYAGADGEFSWVDAEGYYRNAHVSFESTQDRTTVVDPLDDGSMQTTTVHTQLDYHCSHPELCGTDARYDELVTTVEVFDADGKKVSKDHTVDATGDATLARYLEPPAPGTCDLLTENALRTDDQATADQIVVAVPAAISCYAGLEPTIDD